MLNGAGSDGVTSALTALLIGRGVVLCWVLFTYFLKLAPLRSYLLMDLITLGYLELTMDNLWVVIREVPFQMPDNVHPDMSFTLPLP